MDTDVEKILKRMQIQSLFPNGDSYNTLLCRYATKGDQNNTLRVLRQMHTAGYRADQYTYNQLLKLYMVLNNLAEAEKVSFVPTLIDTSLSSKHQLTCVVNNIILFRLYCLGPCGYAAPSRYPD